MSRRIAALASFGALLISCSEPATQLAYSAEGTSIEEFIDPAATESLGLNSSDIVVDPSAFRLDHFIEEWAWLTGEDVTPIAVTAMGDLIFSGKDGEVLFLDVATGTIEPLAASQADLENRLTNESLVAQIFKVELLSELRDAGISLADNEVYSISIPIGRGGTLTRDNFLAIDMDVHFVLMGQIYRQLREVAEGVEIGNVELSD